MDAAFKLMRKLLCDAKHFSKETKFDVGWSECLVNSFVFFFPSTIDISI